MKTSFFSAVVLAITGVLLTTVSCKKTMIDSSSVGTLRVSAPFASQTSQFAFDITKQVVSQEGVAKNVFISPLSLHVALGMILNGANGQTAQEIQKTLKLDAQTMADANKTYQNLMEK